MTIFDNPESFCRERFDYLVIGGGTAGLVVANRLSANPNIKVGVLEAGSTAFDEPLINIPGRFGESLGTKYDWKFETIPQKGLAGRKLNWPRGKVLGGTSALNFMTWNRGCREDYDAWEALGNDGWGWDGLLRFFKKSEHFYMPPAEAQEKHFLYADTDYHGTTGPISSVYSTEFGYSHQYWHPTLLNLGIKINKSHFGGSNVGSWTSLTSVNPDARTRSYSVTGYYQPAASRVNLIVLPDALVEQIIIEKVNGHWTGTGAMFSNRGVKYHARASLEVIISAGSVQSPQILEISGVGDPMVLQAAGVKVKVGNSNVGENLQDHMMTTTIYEISTEVPTLDDLRSSPDLLAISMASYATSAEGPLTQIPSSVCYLPFSAIIPTSKLCNIASQISSDSKPPCRYTFLRHNILKKRFNPESHLGQIEFNFDTSNYSSHFTPEPGKKYATMMQMLQYPFSVGSIHIPASTTKTTIQARPVIDPKYYQGDDGEIDFLTMVESQVFSHKITTTAPLSSMIVKRVFPPLPEKGKEDDLHEYVRNYTTTDWHPIGTCAMGPLPEEGGVGGVVDSRLRVHGINRLRVIDASIMPLHVSAHIQATVYAIAEKGASLILEDYDAISKG